MVSMPCGYDLAKTRAEMHWLTGRPDWPRPERRAREGHVYLADGNQYLNRPGPRVAESLRTWREILYLRSFEPALEFIGWEKF